MTLQFWFQKKKKLSSLYSFVLHKEIVHYQLHIRKQSKNIRITIASDGKIRVTSPKWMPEKLIRKLLQEKSSWIEAHLQCYKTHDSSNSFNSKKEYLKHKDQALIFVKKKVEELNVYYKFSYKKITVKNQKTLWGSCSRKGNLNFNYKIIHLPEKLANYIIVHELCHLQECNHGKRFWSLVSETTPNYLTLKNELKETKLHS